MFFYVSLFTASLIVALVALWLYHLLTDAGRTVYRSFSSGAKNTPPLAYVERKVAHSTASGTPTPWGWGENTNPSQAARAAAIAPADAVPWGWPGNESKDRAPQRHDELKAAEASLDEMGPKQIKESAIGWPYREEKSELAGTAYKVTRKATSKQTNLNPADRPWGW
ncbi:MAG: hypothetical protein BMS9Abin30_1021 [Gammaproteobacteria bacterium]|nr:MAG: hypothetical protein BMS9Abin30_1021 [Gammaproteobacteria bacterium]